MQIISKGYGFVSLTLIIVGFFIGRYLSHGLYEFLKPTLTSEFGLYIGIFCFGLPFCVLNIYECKFIWSKLFKQPKLDLLGVSFGLIFGFLSLFFIG